ncbi:putative mycofactocin radical SAM maturase MftC [termite gut metagenome]|uniref:Putative mycofactocin radical SAM maturase MftC n=1 Tax=termite gut metagenome TaxID=433724 RepID=A0A5J4R7F8_9ZZZZ
MRKLIYLAFWFLKVRFLGKQKPLQTVLFISEKCNLKCRHCTVYKKDNPYIKTYSQIKEELEYSYRKGSRFVDFEGGEPMIWSDGEYTINHLVRLAKEIGFFSTTVTTNAQLPFASCEADSMWVSLDGMGTYHEEVRGKGTFERLVQNSKESGHPHLCVNMVINSLNYPSVKDCIKFAKENPYIRSISLNFHTPFRGTEYLFVGWDTRRKIIDDIIRMKKEGYPIMNSVSGLRLMKTNNFPKQCWVSNFIMADGTRLVECQGKTVGVCDCCGFCMAGEMRSLFTLKPDTILAGMKLRI